MLLFKVSTRLVVAVFTAEAAAELAAEAAVSAAAAEVYAAPEGSPVAVAFAALKVSKPFFCRLESLRCLFVSPSSSAIC